MTNAKPLRILNRSPGFPFCQSRDEQQIANVSRDYRRHALPTEQHSLDHARRGLITSKLSYAPARPASDMQRCRTPQFCTCRMQRAFPFAASNGDNAFSGWPEAATFWLVFWPADTRNCNIIQSCTRCTLESPPSPHHPSCCTWQKCERLTPNRTVSYPWPHVFCE